MVNKTDIKSMFLRSIKISKYLPIYVFMCLGGLICAMGPDLWTNETTNTLTGYSLFISIIALFISNYFIVENAIESRANNKKKLFSEYCARFLNNHNICKVAEWLLAIAEFDSNGVLTNVNPGRMKDNNGSAISEPTFFQKKCFGDFFLELSIQIKNKQLEKEDVRIYFSLYASIFKKVLQVENNKIYYTWNSADFLEII